jgi:hypothetical protein
MKICHFSNCTIYKSVKLLIRIEKFAIYFIKKLYFNQLFSDHRSRKCDENNTHKAYTMCFNVISIYCGVIN